MFLQNILQQRLQSLNVSKWITATFTVLLYTMTNQCHFDLDRKRKHTCSSRVLVHLLKTQRWCLAVLVSASLVDRTILLPKLGLAVSETARLITRKTKHASTGGTKIRTPTTKGPRRYATRCAMRSTATS